MSQAPPKPRRRWYQFSLRTLLIATAAAAGLAFAWAKCIEPYRVQRNAAAAITKLGGTYKSEDATGWVRYLDKNAQDVLVVDLADCDTPDEYLPHVARLPNLRTLILGGHQVGDEQVVALGRVVSLKGLVLDSTLVGDEGVDGLKEKLPDVEVWKSERRASAELVNLGAMLSDTDFPSATNHALQRHDVPPDWLFTDAGDAHFAKPVSIVLFFQRRGTEADLAWLTNLENIRAIDFEGAHISDDGLSHLTGVRQLVFLRLSNNHVTDAGLRHLIPLIHLDSLSLDRTAVTDKGILSLEKLTRLTFLGVPRKGISPDGERRLRDALPCCRVFWTK